MNLLSDLAGVGRAGANGRPSGYEERPVHWACHLAPTGKLVRWTRLTADPVPGKKAKAGPPPGRSMLVPEVRRGSGVLPFLACDTAEYVLGRAGLPLRKKGQTDAQYKRACKDRAERVRTLYHPAFVALVIDCHKATGNAAIAAVETFLTQPGWSVPPEVEPTDRIAFWADSTIPHLDPKVQEFWANRQQTRTTGGGDGAHCVACGRHRPMARVLTGAVRDVPKSQQNKCSLVSANAPSVEHYGQAQLGSVQLCAECGEASVRGLNQLIAAQWAEAKTGELLVLAWPDEARAVWRAVRTGVPVSGLDDWHGDAHVLLLGAHQGRAVVYDYQILPSDRLVANATAWHTSQGPTPAPLIGCRDGETDIWRWGILQGLSPTRDAGATKAVVVADIVRAALFGQPLPPGLAATASYRPRAGGPPEPLAALLHIMKGTEMSGSADSPAYRAGRLLGLLDRIQRAAIPRIGQTSAATVLKSAAATPAAVLGQQLLRARAHLGKLERRSTGGKYSKALDEALQGLDLPERLTPADQGVFVIGYYEGRK